MKKGKGGDQRHNDKTERKGNKIYEVMGDISWTPFPFVDIHGGYKTFVIDIDEDDVIFDYDMSGPYVALTVSF